MFPEGVTMKTENYVLTPQGRVHKSRIHQVKDQGGPASPGPISGPAPGVSVLQSMSPNGWKASAIFAAADPLGKMIVSFKVPEAPSMDGAIIFLFAGAENAQMRMILQPVLQWGYNGLEGTETDGWTIACWYVSPEGHWYVSQPQCVDVGDVVTGTLQVVTYSCSPEACECEWVVEASTSKVSTILRNGALLKDGDHVPLMLRFLMLFLIGAALEAYPEKPCCTDLLPEQYPASGATTFEIIELADLAGHPLRADWHASCAQENMLCDCPNTVVIGPEMRMITLRY
jgi:hypothetical protein